MNWRRHFVIVAALAVLVGGCADRPGGEDTSVTIIAHDFFFVDEALIAGFESETGIDVEIIRGGDAGIVVNQAVLTAGNPVADVLFGVDTTLLSRALEGEVFEPYESPLLAGVPEGFVVDARVTPIDFGDVCVNYDKTAFGAGSTAPATLADLADPQYAGMLVVEDPTISSPGLAFVLATIAEFGEDGEYTWLDYWAELRANDVLVAPDWGTAYYGHFSGASDGDRPLVVSYASSPGAELLGENAPEEPSTATFTTGCFRQVEYAGVLRGAEHPDAARRFIDFLLGGNVQQDVPWSMFVYPVVEGTALPEWIGPIPAAPERTIEPRRIEMNRERWLREWTDVVLR